MQRLWGKNVNSCIHRLVQATTKKRSHHLHIEVEVSPHGAGDTAEEEASCELWSPFGGPQLVSLLFAASERERSLIEWCDAVHGEVDAEDGAEIDGATGILWSGPVSAKGTTRR